MVLLGSLLLVKDDIFSFSSAADESNLLNLVCEPFGESKTIDTMTGTSGLYRLQGTPIVPFLNRVFHMEESASNHYRPYFWKRMRRWIHADLSSQDTTGSSNPTEAVNARILNYSVYNRLYKYTYALCTCVTWIAVAVVFLINLSSLQIFDLRLLLLAFFVCPLTVAILESAYEGVYFVHLIGYWFSLKVRLPIWNDK